METKFNSQICTTKGQSERLLALGLKKETADCHWCNASVKGKNYQDDWQLGTLPYCNVLQVWDNYAKDSCWELIPAWSLHRLLNLIQQSLNISKGITILLPYDVPFDDCIERIEHLIKEGYFNKDYLENGDN